MGPAFLLTQLPSWQSAGPTLGYPTTYLPCEHQQAVPAF